MRNILLSVNGVGVISKNNFLFTSFERTVYPWELIEIINYQEFEHYGNYTKYKNRYSHKTTQLDETKAKIKRSNSKEGTKIHLEPVNFNLNMKQSSNGDFDEKGLVYN